MKVIRESSLPVIDGKNFFKVFKETQRESVYDSDPGSYKWSKYNIVESFDDSVMIYNLASDGACLFDTAEIGDQFGQDLTSCTLNSDVIEALIRIGALVNKKTDEDLVLSIVRQNQIINPDNEFKVAINTTYDCNARCDYCFECGAERTKMKPETADDVAKYISNNINKDTLLTYRWFGGEPLMATDIIDRIINKVNEYSPDQPNYRSVILSNGTVYNEDIINKMLNEWHVYEFHVTLDGPKDLHNKKKRFIDSNLDGYTRIIALIKRLLENNIIVVCRINVDKNNIDSVEEIVTAFDAYKNNDLLNVYIAPTRRHTKSSEDYSFDYTEYDELYDKVFKILYQHNLLPSAQNLLPKRKVTCCSTRAVNELVIDTNGSFFKCMQTSTTDQKCVGNSKEGLELNEELSQWLIPQTPEECVGCIYMPICQAGCKGFRSLNNPLVSPCVKERYYLKTLLKYVKLMCDGGEK